MKKALLVIMFLVFAIPSFADAGFVLGDKSTTKLFTEVDVNVPVRYHDSVNAFARIGYNQKIDADKSIKYYAGMMAVSGREFESPYTAVAPVVGISYYQELN